MERSKHKDEEKQESSEQEEKGQQVQETGSEEPEAEQPEEASGEAVTITSEEFDALQERASERDRLYDRLLRTTAELINYQNRVERERRDWKKAGMVDFLSEILPVVDNFHRAIATAEKASEAKGLLEGLRLIDDQLHKILEDFSVRPMETVGQRFDPTLHEAVALEERDDIPDHTVLEELQRGYVIDKKVIRPAKVRVSKKPQGAESRPKEEEKEV